MELREADIKIERLNNDIDRLLKQKEINLLKTQPKITEMKEIIVSGGKQRSDRFLDWLIEDEEIDPLLDIAYAERDNLQRWLDNELKVMKKYSLLEKKIYDLRNNEEYIAKNGKTMEWWKIAQKVGYSKRQCLRIYARITRKRYND